MAESGDRPDGRVERGNRTRAAVLSRAVQIASTDGLAELSLGRLASEVGVSKSGIFTLFGSKQSLQLATIEAARAVFVEHVVGPAREVPDGLDRLRALCSLWLDYSRARVFAGGCFFSAVTAEFDSRTGPVRAAVVDSYAAWSRHVRSIAARAVDSGDMVEGTDIDQLEFELTSLLEMANTLSLLHGDDAVYERALVAVEDRLGRAASRPERHPWAHRAGAGQR